MMTIKHKTLIYLINCIKKIRIWYWRFRHTSNARIIRASKLLNRIHDLNGEYDLVEIYSDFKTSDVEKCSNLPNNNNFQNFKPEETSSNNP